MRKYKVGDRFEIEIEGVEFDYLGNEFYKVKNINDLNSLKQIKPQTGKYDCSKALDWAHERDRMHKFYCDNFLTCNECPMMIGDLTECDRAYTQKSVDIVQSWSDEHPEEEPKHEKTLEEDFFEKFPNAQRDPNGIPRANPCDIYGEVKCSDFDCGSGECWNIPLKEVKKT